MKLTETRKRTDWADFIRELVDGHYKEAERVVMVMDQLNTHSVASLYETFPRGGEPMADRLEVHHTPGHGSWLNIAEIELSVFSRDLPDRVGGRPAMVGHVAAWKGRRNGAGKKADWRFTTADARVKLHKLYPTIDA